MSKTKYCNQIEHETMSFDVRRSIRYHLARQAFFEDWSRLITGLNILLSSSAIVSLTSQSPKLAPLLMLLLAVLNTIDLVIGTSKSAWLHRDLKNQFIELEKAFFRDNRITQSELNEAKQIRLSIEALEPPIYRNLDLYCHNELVNSMHWDNEADKLKALAQIGWFRKLLRNYIRTVN